MKTDSQAYSDYLRAKYFPGRRLYLRWFFYPRLFRRFTTTETIVDLGCGTGEFLRYCRKKHRDVLGVDSNELLANRCRREGFKIIIDNICELNAFNGQLFKYAICDNVLEHLEQVELDNFFNRLQTLLLPGGILICIVPGVRGFKCDPTHKTFIHSELLAALLKERSLKIVNRYYHPINLTKIDTYLYLNMQVFEIEKLRATEDTPAAPRA